MNKRNLLLLGFAAVVAAQLAVPAWMIIDLLTNPLNSGKAEIDKPPMSVKAKVHGIFW